MRVSNIYYKKFTGPSQNCTAPFNKVPSTIIVNMNSGEPQKMPPTDLKQHVYICKAADVGRASTGQTEGMIRKSALVGCSEKVCNGIY